MVTSKSERRARPILEQLPFGQAFARPYGPDRSSAHSERVSIAAALVDFDAAPGEAAMIGDRRFDIEGALVNRVQGIGVLWGSGSRKELAGTHALARDPPYLVDLLAA